jgi:mannose-6-phosphate isomerase-like protein (cupin superfamily)
MTQQAKDTLPEPIRDGLGGTILGPRNVPLERENPDLLASPVTDSGTIPNLKFSFANARNRLHWHPTNDEWQYYISGQAKMTVFASSGKARTFDYQAGDVGYVPFAMGHYILNTGTEPVRFLEMFRSDRYADVSLNQWIALTPPELVKAHLNLDDATAPTAVIAYKGKPIMTRASPSAPPASPP